MDARKSDGRAVFRTRAGESELSGKLKVGRASLGEEREGSRVADIINAAVVCRAQARHRVSGGQRRTERQRALAGDSAKTLGTDSQRHREHRGLFGRARG